MADTAIQLAEEREKLKVAHSHAATLKAQMNAAKVTYLEAQARYASHTSWIRHQKATIAALEVIVLSQQLFT